MKGQLQQLLEGARAAGSSLTSDSCSVAQSSDAGGSDSCATKGCCGFGSVPPLPLWVIEICYLQQPSAPATQDAAATDTTNASTGRPGTFEPSQPRVLLGVELVRGGAVVQLAGLHDGKGRAGGGPTQMKPELALATANLASLCQASAGMGADPLG